MADAMNHRGPDGEGFHSEHDVIIGMRRLAIIDLSGGWQPLSSEDASIVLVANGEIYNYVELRESLARRGHVFATGSDCETILHLYEDHGEDCVHHLRGMFAFALLDRRRRKLVIARDRMGEKPLAYHDDGSCLTFCSEIGGLVASGKVEPTISAAAAKSYFHWQFVPEPMAAIEGVRKLDAGSMLCVDLQRGTRSIRRYWRLSDAPPIDGDPVQRIREELEQVGRLTSRSDVPIAVGLSGGIDSSAIAVLAQRYSRQPVTAISIGYEGLTWQDERSLARQFARHIDMPLIEHRVSVREVVERFPAMCIRLDDPVHDISGSSFDALYSVAHDAGLKVVLGGHGGDELFWGYTWCRTAALQTIRKRMLLAGAAGLGSYLGVEAPPLSLTGTIDWAAGLGGALRGLREFRRDRSTSPHRIVFWDLRGEFSHAERRFHRFAGDRVVAEAHDPAAKFSDPFDVESIDLILTELICSTFLQSNGMILCDRLGMAAKVEGRLPLVDYRLAEIVVGLRRCHSDRHLGHKRWLIDALRHLVPEFVLHRRKRGFTPPWRQWFSAIAQTHGRDLADGELVRQGVLSRRGAQSLSSPMTMLGQPRPFWMSAMVLEQWARGMALLHAGTARYRGAHAESADPVLPGRKMGGVERPTGSA
jgi:asparagine synthase (glutamine-hydrolysing)